MRHREVCSLREGQKFSLEPAFKALPFCFWSLVDKGFSAPFLPVALCLFLCLRELEGENSRELKG